LWAKQEASAFAGAFCFTEIKIIVKIEE